MKRNRILMIILIMVICFIPRDVRAYSAANYESRTLCGNYELASFKSTFPSPKTDA